MIKGNSGSPLFPLHSSGVVPGTAPRKPEISKIGMSRLKVRLMLNSEHSGLVFFLWGSYAQKKRVLRRDLPIQAPRI